ncbi:MAG: TonB-dependent receptor [Gemmataceae bacterium]|nr:TonB-dependent receptor [Gemmataceae bacterium]
MAHWRIATFGITLAIGTGLVFAADPGSDRAKADDKSPEIIQVKKQPIETPQPLERAPEAPQPQTPQAAAAANDAPSQAPSTPPADKGPAAGELTAGNLATKPNADLGAALNAASSSTGVEIQRRNAVIADARIRGYHFGQAVTYGDHGLFFPARLDLDTAISKFDTESIRDLYVIKGPYSVRYGPGFAFLDIVTFDSPRATGCRDWELHGRTTLGYQTNGQRWAGLQSVEYGAKDFGFRATYNILAGNDYYAPGYTSPIEGSNRVPSSYNSNNFNFAVGVDLTPNSSIEFKGLRIHQQDLEFPGLYFDIDRLDTEAYSLRWTLRNNPYFDLLTVDAWYNTTVVDGSTTQGYKQNFLSQFLPGPNGFGLTPTRNQPQYPNFVSSRDAQGNPTGYLPLFTDSSTTHIAQSTEGIRAAFTWGPKESVNFTLGADFTRINNSLTENINVLDPSGQVPTTPVSTPGQPTLLQQQLGIPESNYLNPGIFADMSIPVGDQFLFRAGGRVDYVRTSTGNRIITGNIDLFGGAQAPGVIVDRATVNPVIFSQAPWDNETTRNFGLFASYLSGEYKIDECLTGLMGFGYSMRAPTITELYADGPFVGILQPGFNRLIGEPRLDPEKLTQFDIGLRGDYGWFKGNVNAFYAWIHDYITFDRNKSGEGITQVIFTNTDLATLAGGEIYGQIEATRWLTPFGSATYVQGRDLTHRSNNRPDYLVSSRRDGTDTEPLPGIPPLELRSGLRVHESVDNNQSPKYSVECVVRSVFTQGLYAASLQEQRTGGFTIVDIRAYWQVNSSLLVTAGVENVGDRLYREHLDPRAGDLLFRPGTNYYLTTQWKY